MSTSTNQITALISKDEMEALIKKTNTGCRRHHFNLTLEYLNNLHLDLREILASVQAAKNEPQVNKYSDYIKIFHGFLNYIVTEKPDENQLEAYYKTKIAEGGNVQAIAEYMLSYFYWTIKLQPDDRHGDRWVSETFKFLKNSAEKGLVSSQIRLSEWYLSQSTSLPADSSYYHDQVYATTTSLDVDPLQKRLENVVFWMNKAKEQGSVRAKEQLPKILVEVSKRQAEFKEIASLRAKTEVLYLRIRIEAQSKALGILNGREASSAHASTVAARPAPVFAPSNSHKRKIEPTPSHFLPSRAAAASASASTAAVSASASAAAAPAPSVAAPTAIASTSATVASPLVPAAPSLAPAASSSVASSATPSIAATASTAAAVVDPLEALILACTLDTAIENNAPDPTPNTNKRSKMSATSTKSKPAPKF